MRLNSYNPFLESVNRCEFAWVFEFVLHCIDHCSCALTDKVGMQLLAMSDLLDPGILSIVTPLRDPRTQS